MILVYLLFKYGPELFIYLDTIVDINSTQYHHLASSAV